VFYLTPTIPFVEGATSGEEVKAFFENEAFNVWAVFLDTFNYYEQSQKSSKQDTKGTISSFQRSVCVNPYHPKNRYREAASHFEKNIDLFTRKD
jgi:hypothetical protein